MKRGSEAFTKNSCRNGLKMAGFSVANVLCNATEGAGEAIRPCGKADEGARNTVCVKKNVPVCRIPLLYFKLGLLAAVFTYSSNLQILIEHGSQRTAISTVRRGGSSPSRSDSHVQHEVFCILPLSL